MGKLAAEDRIVHDKRMGIDRRVVAGDVIPADLVEAYEEAGGSTKNQPTETRSRLTGDTARPVIAKQDIIVHDEAMGIDRRLFAGQEVPPDLVKAYKTGVGESTDEPGPETGYEDQSVDELEVEADRRDLKVEGTGKDGNVLKADLVAALEADDKEGGEG